MLQRNLLLPGSFPREPEEPPKKPPASVRVSYRGGASVEKKKRNELEALLGIFPLA